MSTKEEIDDLIKSNICRPQVYGIIPENAEKILDFGCNQGALLLKLKRDKHCKQLYGVEIREEYRQVLQKYLDHAWIMNMEEEHTELGKEFEGFFNYIIMHDVVEHLYDPWYVLAKLRKYLSESGRLILVAPNMQYWKIFYELSQGWFLYGAEGGIMNEEHIRWFTHNSLTELAALSGFEIEKMQLLFPDTVELKMSTEQNKCLQFPLAKNLKPGQMYITLHNFNDQKNDQQLFFANKIMLVCSPSEMPVDPERIKDKSLNVRRKKLRDFYKNIKLLKS
ncbi:MAG: hypothetical protein DRP78_02125 [Candidatus Omnitrophota bacterium]|nr:MAG: hypothetical protein DRP78_02125 [Candidatus Omnitrophota bacterium]